jgi:predicted nucleic acid-binding protein
VVIAAERKGKTLFQILEQFQSAYGETELGLSVITIAELMHGAHRAQTSHQQKQRLAFINDLCLDVPVYPITLGVARVAGRIQGEQEAIGVRCPFEDLFIGVTALSLGYGLATSNVRHFQTIPGLQVLQA